MSETHSQKSVSVFFHDSMVFDLLFMILFSPGEPDEQAITAERRGLAC